MLDQESLTLCAYNLNLSVSTHFNIPGPEVRCLILARGDSRDPTQVLEQGWGIFLVFLRYHHFETWYEPCPDRLSGTFGPPSHVNFDEDLLFLTL